MGFVWVTLMAEDSPGLCDKKIVTHMWLATPPPCVWLWRIIFGFIRIYIDLCWFAWFFVCLYVFLRSPSRVCVCCAACGASPTSEKHAPGILEHVPYVFYWFVLNFVQFWCFFTGFGVSQQGVCVWRCLRRFADLRKTRPWNFGACLLCCLSIFVVFVYLYISFWQF